MTKVYIFDVDGTLIDSMGEWGRALPQFLKERGISYPSDIVKRVIALGLPGVAKYYKENFPVKESEEEILSYLVCSFQEKYAHEIEAKAEVLETLKTLKSRGVRLCALTAGMHVLFDECLRRLGISDLLEYCWSSDDFPTTKADPAIYQMAAQRLGVAPSECVMVDDSLAALAPAKAAGLKTIGVYDDFSKENEAEMRKLADRYIYSFQELV